MTADSPDSAGRPRNWSAAAASTYRQQMHHLSGLRGGALGSRVGRQAVRPRARCLPADGGGRNASSRAPSSRRAASAASSCSGVFFSAAASPAAVFFGNPSCALVDSLGGGAAPDDGFPRHLHAAIDATTSSTPRLAAEGWRRPNRARGGGHGGHLRSRAGSGTGSRRSCPPRAPSSTRGRESGLARHVFGVLRVRISHDPARMVNSMLTPVSSQRREHIGR